MARYWTCPKCKTVNERVKQRCPVCARKRPAPRKVAHNVALEQPYEQWVERFGERCGICGCAPSAARRLDRDHDHGSGQARGLLCHTCNRTLSNRITVEWLKQAIVYLEREVEKPKELIDLVVAVARSDPDGSRVTWRFNNNPWETSTGREFLELWEQPVAGTIDVDSVVSVP